MNEEIPNCPECGQPAVGRERISIPDTTGSFDTYNIPGRWFCRTAGCPNRQANP